MPKNVFGIEQGGLRWDERLVRSHFLKKIDGLNDAAKRHNSMHYAEKFASHRRWAGWGSVLLIMALVIQVFDGNWRIVQDSSFFLMALIYWWDCSKGLEQMFVEKVREINTRLASDPELRERFAAEQHQVNQQLEIQRRQRQIQAKKDEVIGLQKQLESLHRRLGFEIERGTPLSQADVRAQIARTESELRSRGH